MASPAFRFAAQSPGVKYAASAGEVVAATLDSISGVNATSWAVISTDETGLVGDYALTISGIKDSICTLTAGGVGTALLLQATINNGQDQGVYNPATTIASAKLYVPASNGLECLADNEEKQSDPIHGWTGTVNEAIRTAGSTGAASLIATVQTLVYGATVNVNLALGGVCLLTLAGSPTIANPTNKTAGARYTIHITRGAGGEAVTWNAAFVFGAWDSAPAAGAGIKTTYEFECVDALTLRCVGRSFETDQTRFASPVLGSSFGIATTGRAASGALALTSASQTAVAQKSSINGAHDVVGLSFDGADGVRVGGTYATDVALIAPAGSCRLAGLSFAVTADTSACSINGDDTGALGLSCTADLTATGGTATITGTTLAAMVSTGTVTTSLTLDGSGDLATLTAKRCAITGGANGAALTSASGPVTVQGGATSTVSTTAGDLTVTGAGACTLSATSGLLALTSPGGHVEASTGGASHLTLTAGSGGFVATAVAGDASVTADASKTATLDCGAGGTVSVGQGSAAKTCVVGNATGATSLALTSGTGGTTATSTGDIAITAAAAKAASLDCGAGGTATLGAGAAAKDVTVGNATGASSLALKAGTGSMALSAQGTGGIGLTCATGSASAIALTCGSGGIVCQSVGGDISFASSTRVKSSGLTRVTDEATPLTTPGATATTIYTVPVPTNTLAIVTLTISAHDSAFGDYYVTTVRFSAIRVAGAPTSNAPVTFGTAGGGLAIGGLSRVDNATTVDIQVTGIAATSILWSASIDILYSPSR